MAGIARKVGSKDSRFCAFVPRLFYVLPRAFFTLSSGPRPAERKERRASRSRPPFPLALREAEEEERESNFRGPSSGRATGKIHRFSSLRGVRLRLIMTNRIRARFEQWKTGRFGPIGPETAQCQLPHNIVTFGMVRARDARVSRTWMRRRYLPFVLLNFELTDCESYLHYRQHVYFFVLNSHPRLCEEIYNF